MRKGLPRVKWAHHPLEIKAAIRRSGVPLIKQCFANCQKFIIYGQLDGAVYHEGVVRGAPGSMIQHAWIEWRGGVVDLTLRDAKPVNSYTVAADEIREIVMARGWWGPVFPTRLDDLYWRVLMKSCPPLLPDARHQEEVQLNGRTE